MAMLLKIYVLVLLLPAVLSGTCTLTEDENKNEGRIYCTMINQEKYVSSIYEFIPNIVDFVTKNGWKSTFSITIRNSNLPDITEWIYLPWMKIGDDRDPTRYVNLVKSLVIFNSSVKLVDSTMTSDGFRGLLNLDLGGNNISDYTFLQYVNLKNLQLSYTNLDLSDQSFLYTYLQNNRNLQMVNFSHCNISSFVHKGYNNYNNFDLSNNPLLEIVNIYVGNYDNDKMLLIDGSYNIQNFKSDVGILKMSGLKGNFTFNLLANITVNNLTLRDNNIYTLDNSIFVLKNILYLKRNFTSVDLANNNLNYISEAYFQNYNLYSLILSQNNLTQLTNYTFNNSKIDNLDISISKVNYIDSTVFYGLKVVKLDLSKNKLTTLEHVFDNISSVNELNLAYNPIEFINNNTFSNCTMLQVLNLTNCYMHKNSIGTNTFAGLISLYHLELSLIDTFDSYRIKNPLLETLVIRNSNLTSLENQNFKGFYNLKYLYFPGTNVSNINNQSLQGLFIIREIDANNLISSSRLFVNVSIFSNLTSLQHLNISYKFLQKLSSSDFKGLTHLKTLNASFNSISTIDVETFYDLSSLEVLSLEHNLLSELPKGVFSTLKNVTHLYLNNNNIQSILGVLSGLDQLIFLDISYNNLQNYNPSSSRIFPYNLMYLFIQFNNIDYVYIINNLEIFNSLERIDINSNAGNCDNLNVILLYFEKKGIKYTPLNPIYDTNNINGVSCT